MDISIREMAEKLKDYDNYCIVYHIRPDGDCTCSSYALAVALQSVGKKCTVEGQDDIPRIHRYMTDKVKLDTIDSPIYIVVDSASVQRVGSYGNKHFTFCIDHHHNTFESADYRYVETDCGACSEIIYKLIKEMGITVTKQMAELLYTAIVTDTMCFRTTDTRVQTFEIAAELAKAGADVYHIGRINTFIKSSERMRIESILRDSFHFTCDNKVVTGIIMQNDLETAGVLDSDIEGINSLVEQIEGVRIGVTIRELPDGRMRCSMRSNGKISANDICRLHGGGGHFHAACCELDMNAAEARDVIEQTCREYLESNSDTDDICNYDTTKTSDELQNTIENPETDQICLSDGIVQTAAINDRDTSGYDNFSDDAVCCTIQNIIESGDTADAETPKATFFQDDTYKEEEYGDMVALRIQKMSPLLEKSIAKKDAENKEYDNIKNDRSLAYTEKSVIDRHFENNGYIVMESSALKTITGLRELTYMIGDSFTFTASFLTEARKAICKPTAKGERILKMTIEKNAAAFFNRFAYSLKHYGILTKYVIDRNIFTASISPVPRVINYLTGQWLEMYSAFILEDVVRDYATLHNYKYEILMNVKVSSVASIGKYAHELDCVFSVDNKCFAFEVKSGQFEDYCNLYNTRKELHFVPDHFLLLSTSLDETAAATLEYFYEFYITGMTKFKSHLTEMINNAFSDRCC